LGFSASGPQAAPKCQLTSAGNGADRNHLQRFA
jgi:hypothetical protein